MAKVLGVLHVVYNLSKMAHFFENVLGYQHVQEWHWPKHAFDQLFELPTGEAKIARLQLGEESSYLLEFSPSHPLPHYFEFNSHDLYFQHIAIVVSNMEKAHQKVMDSGVKAISEDHQTIPEWNEAAAGVKAFYFRSPEGHPLELIYFPPGKGKEKWQNPHLLFLGIDHTAIVVSQTEASILFYHDFLGMEPIGGSLNYSETQEKLSGVTDPKVEITNLCFPNSNGMGIEFLDYVKPLGGREKIHTNWKERHLDTTTLIAIDNIDSIAHRLQEAKIHFSKVESVKLFDHYHKALWTIDPDGHSLLLLE